MRSGGRHQRLASWFFRSHRPTQTRRLRGGALRWASASWPRDRCGDPLGMGGTGGNREGRSTPHHQIVHTATGAKVAGRHLGNDISPPRVLPDCGSLFDCLAPMAANVLPTCEPARDSQGGLQRALASGLRLCYSANRMTGTADKLAVIGCGGRRDGQGAGGIGLDSLVLTEPIGEHGHGALLRCGELDRP